IVNGLEFNGFIIYGIDKYLLDKEPKQAINGFIDNNKVWHENEWQQKYLFIGDSSISWYVYDMDTNKFCELDKPGGKVINVFDNIELIIIKILEDALQ
ncbi:MAG: YrhA family protein, partial [Lachnoclostridium sp.]|nr:YrhA family protein [Lachnoclostridium sp.]